MQIPPGDPIEPTMAGSSQPPPAEPSNSVADSQLIITLGFVLLTAIAVLLLSVALRFLRRAADPETHGFGKRKPTRGFERGRSVDPWREAGRRLAVPPKSKPSQPDDGGDSEEDGESETGGRR
jgi:hypothetical protein